MPRKENQLMEIGIGLPSAIPGRTPTQFLEWAKRADKLGFSCLGTLDRVVYDNYEPLSALAAAAAVTDRIRLTTTVLLGPLRTNTALLAKQAATVHALSDGRLVLGLGLGGREDDYAASNVPRAGRGATLAAQARELREIWGGQERGFAGAIGPAVPQGRQPEILFGGSTPLALSRAARHADGWIMGGGAPAQFGTLSQQFDQAWTEAGRSGRPRKISLARFSLGPSARADADSYLGDFYRWLGDNAKAIVAGASVDPAAVRACADAFEAGCDELIFFPCSVGLEQVELLADALQPSRLVPA
jgi:alkanesulfonate monooxygenase SsuD/methylene tetrahydromethanopterin reductase-like flavin-dependent oxidoreductase (luciferase family)